MSATAKVAALGLKIKNGCSYHGLSLNVDMDLHPFTAINPCGYAGLKVTQTRDLGVPLTAHEAGERLSQHLLQHLDTTTWLKKASSKKASSKPRAFRSRSCRSTSR